MDSFLFLIVVAGLVSVVGGILFWGAIAWAGIKAAKNFSSGGGGFGGTGLVGLDPTFAAAVQQIQQLIAQAQAAQAQQHGAPGGRFAVPDHLQQQFDSQFLRAQQQIRTLDTLGQQRHDTMVSGMLSDASAAGLDVSRWRF